MGGPQCVTSLRTRAVEGSSTVSGEPEPTQDAECVDPTVLATAECGAPLSVEHC